jgi:hypothetical protein
MTCGAGIIQDFLNGKSRRPAKVDLSDHLPPFLCAFTRRDAPSLSVCTPLAFMYKVPIKRISQSRWSRVYYIFCRERNHDDFQSLGQNHLPSILPSQISAFLSSGNTASSVQQSSFCTPFQHSRYYLQCAAGCQCPDHNSPIVHDKCHISQSIQCTTQSQAMVDQQDEGVPYICYNS